MLKKATKVLTNKLTKLYLRLISSVAFYPTLIAFGLFFLALLSLYVDEQTPSRIFGNEIPIKNILAPSSVRALLAGIAGGMISLMVFSFSMVMVILNQTSSSYSPRLLPNLIEKRHHQVVLGFYLGTIAYTFIVLSSIQSRMYTFGVPSLSVTINALLSIICLGLFISFINNISQIIQIGNIVRDLHAKTLKGLQYEINREVYVPQEQLPDTGKWPVIYSSISGYLDSVEHRYLLRMSSEMDVKLRFCLPLGQFVNRRDPLLCCSRPLSDKEKARLLRALVFRHQENVSQNYVYGFKELSEIATRAISPGINDPGTALQALDRLTDLFIVRAEISGFKIKTDEHGTLRIIFIPIRFSDLMYFCLGTIINYADNDLPVNHKLIQMLGAIAQNDQQGRHTDIILSMLDDLVTHFMQKFTTDTDKRSLAERAQHIARRYPAHPKSIAIQDKVAELMISEAYR
jgi:uncharacterized membrane protein